ncbi:hypothetical protein FRC03_000444 [Tulasnella sp. 419]|nr:hypothetical protein FRC03_000444 [Tulasnella sp. 419]
MNNHRTLSKVQTTLSLLLNNNGARSLYTTGRASVGKLSSVTSSSFHTSSATRQYVRYVEDSHPGKQRSGLRVSTLFGITMAFGLLGIGYGIYDIYSSMTTWPPELRQDLRIAVRAKQRGDFKSSVEAFRKAYGKAITLSSFGGDRAYQTSAIALALADVLETGTGDLKSAYDVYITALNDLKLNGSLVEENGASRMNGKERARAIGIVMKLTELGGRLRDAGDDVEEHLGWALGEMLKDMGVDNRKEGSEDEGVKELELPRWSEAGLDIVAVLEKAGQFYASRGKTDYAVPLYLQAISSLLPPSQAQQRKDQSESWIHLGPHKIPSAGDRCKAATLMNNLASLFATPTPAHRNVNIPQVKAWADKALEIVTKARESYVVKSTHQLTEDQMLCEETVAVVLFNLGMLSEVRDYSPLDRSSYADGGAVDGSARR